MKREYLLDMRQRYACATTGVKQKHSSRAERDSESGGIDFKGPRGSSFTSVILNSAIRA